MNKRARARELAAESLASGDPTGWFERLYAEAERGESVVPWADKKPNFALRPLSGDGRKALVVGCAFGDDAERIASWGFATTAFDVSPTAIEACRRRFPQSPVHYTAADVLQPPPGWQEAFHFVFEANTFQVLRSPWREQAMHNVASFVAPGGELLVIARAREESDPEGSMPWPLTRRELQSLESMNLRCVDFEELADPDEPGVRRFRALYQKP